MGSGAMEYALFDDGSKQVHLQLNPTSMSISRTANWRAAANRSSYGGMPSSAGGGSNGPITVGHAPLQYAGSTMPGSLSMSLWVDRSFEPDGDVSPDLATLQNWTCPSTPAANGMTQPATVTFTWGTLTFVGHIMSLSISYTLCNADGTPVRAEVQIRMVENPPPTPPTNPTSGGLSGRRVRVMAAGDSLQSIAYEEYGKPGSWRVLAEANAIDDPLRIPSGTALLIPPAHEAAAKTP